MMCFLIVVNTQAGDITKGMIGYWPLDGNAKDVSGNNCHGELDGKVTWAAFVSARGAAGVAYWMGYHGDTDPLTYVWNNKKAETWDWQGSVKIPKDTGA